MEFTSVKLRIEKILQQERISASQFADEIGVQRPNVSHILSGRNNPSLEFVQKILSRYNLINADWLLFGKGNMYKVSQASLFSENELDTPSVQSPLLKEDGSISVNPLPVTPQITETSSTNSVSFVNSTSSSSNSSTSELSTSKTAQNSPVEQPQNSNNTIIPPQINSSEKKVKQIIVLYTDNTFTVYNHE